MKRWGLCRCRGAAQLRYLQASGHAAAGEYDQAIDLYRALNDEAMVNHTIYSKAEVLLRRPYAEAMPPGLALQPIRTVGTAAAHCR